MSNLPAHPFMRHPHTGDALRAVGYRKDGSLIWPIMGASPDDPPKGDPPAGDPPPKADDKPADTGYPANTPVAEMTQPQQTAYWKHQAKKHEHRNTELMTITGGKFGDDLKAEFDELGKLRTSQMSDADKALAAAKDETRTSTIQTMGASAARVALEFALGHDAEKNDQSALIESLDLSKLVNTDGSVAADKVRALVATIAPSAKGQGEQHNFGAGNRGSGGDRPRSVAQVMAARAEARAAKK